MAFKYRGGDRTVEDQRKAAKQAGSSYDSYLLPEASFLKIREGDNTLRILPPTWPEEDIEKWGTGWHISIWLHRNVGPDNGTYLCLDKMKGKPCPVCEARRNATDEDEADKLRVTNRMLCWAIDRDSEKDGPQVFSMPPTLFKDIVNRSVDKKDGSLLLIDGDKDGYGYDVMFTREGTDMRTKYVSVEIDREESPIHDKKATEDKWLDYISDHPLPDMLVFYDAEHIEKVLYGKSERRKKRDDDTEAERPRRGRRAEPEETAEEEDRSSRRPRRGAEPEAEEETEATPGRGRRAEPEEETEETPRRGKATRGREPEESEEVEERPSRRNGRRVAAEEAETDAEEEAPRRGGGVTRKRVAEPEEEAAEDPPSRQARRKVERLRERA